MSSKVCCTWRRRPRHVAGSFLRIGPRPTVDSFPAVVVNSPNQIGDDVLVEVRPGGQLAIRDQEAVGNMQVADAEVAVISSPGVTAISP